MTITAAEILSLPEPVQRWLLERPELPSCANCVHFTGPGIACAAFPDGVPQPILAGEQQHLLPLDGDNGIQWAPTDPAGGTKAVINVHAYVRDGHLVTGYTREGGFSHDARDVLLDVLGPYGYKRVNGYLRGTLSSDTDPWGNHQEPLTPDEAAKLDAQIQVLDAAIRAVGPTERPQKLYRGVQFSWEGIKISEGDDLVDPGYSWASHDRDYADSYADEEGDLLEIATPAGSHLIDFANHPELEEAWRSKEAAVMFARNTTFAVEKIRPRPNSSGRIISVRVKGDTKSRRLVLGLYFQQPYPGEHPHARRHKEAVAVRPYIREGHPVAGYTRFQALKHILDDLRQKMGRPLTLPGIELRNAQMEVGTARYQDQVAEIMGSLHKLPDGSRIEIDHDDIRMLQFGPEAAGITSGLAGVYTKREGEWWREQRIMRAGDREWRTTYQGVTRAVDPKINAVPAQRALNDAEFAVQYRGALLNPLGIGDFAFKQPTDAEIAKWMNTDSLIDGEVSVNSDGLKRWPQDVEAKAGVYVRIDGVWHYYASYADRDANLVQTTLSDEDMVRVFRHRFVDLMRRQHANPAYTAEQKAWEAAVQGSLRIEDYTRGQSPGDLYRRQHEILMEAGAAIDQELRQALEDEDVPTQAEVKAAADAAASARTAWRKAADTQKEAAFTIVRDLVMQRLKALNLQPAWDLQDKSNSGDRMFVFGNPESIHKDLVYAVHVNPYSYDGGPIGALFTASVLGERNRSRTSQPLQLPDGTTYATQPGTPEHWLVRLHRENRTEFKQRLDQFVQEIADIANKQIATTADLKNLIEPLAIAKDAEAEADAEVGFLRSQMQKRTEIVLKVLASHRQMGGELQHQNQRITKGIRGVLNATRYLPSDWIRRANDQPRRWPTIRTQRGKRANYSWDGTITTDGDRGTDLHELVHYMEHTNQQLDAAEWAFWHKRGRGGDFDGPLEPLQWVGSGRKREQGIRDKFSHAYAGKTYGGPGQHWEVLTMGVPALYGLENSDLVWNDEEYRKFVLGALMML